MVFSVSALAYALRQSRNHFSEKVFGVLWRFPHQPHPQSEVCVCVWGGGYPKPKKKALSYPWSLRHSGGVTSMGLNIIHS